MVSSVALARDCPGDHRLYFRRGEITPSSRLERLISEVVGNLVAVRLVVSKRCQGVSLTGGTLALHVLCSPPLRRWGRERLRGTAATDPCGSTLISSGFVNCDLIKSRVRGHAGGSRSRQPALASRGNTRTLGTENPAQAEQKSMKPRQNSQNANRRRT